MKIFYIEHIENGLVLTDFENDYPILEADNGILYFEDKEGDYNYDNYVKYLGGCISIDELIDAAADEEFRIIDDPKNRSRARYTFGREIVRLRKARGIAQSELAERSGIKMANLISIELGRYAASFDNINNIAKALGMKLALV